MPASEDEVTRYLWERRCKTIHRIRVSVLYHLKRERFLDSCDKLVSAATAVSATAAVAVVLKQWSSVDQVAAMITAALSLVPLVFSPAQKARMHGATAADFRRLLAECEKTGERWTEEQCNEFFSRSIEIEASEPAALSALVADCENQLAVASGEGPVADIKLRHRLFMHFVDMRPAPTTAGTK